MVQQWPPLYRLLGGVHGPGRFRFTVAPIGGGGDTDIGFPLTAPVATWVSGATVQQAIFQLIVDDDVVSGDKIWGESSLDNFATVLETVSAAISVGDLSDLQIDDFAFAPFADGLTYARFWVSNSANVQISAKSNIVSLTIGEPNYFPPRYFGNRYFAQRYFG